jgi:glycine/D-amino acid oxidase-like deaminating enzyme
VAAGKADFVALGRSLIAEPQWVEKIRRGDQIRRCIACNTCINEMRGGARIGCVVNPAAGREARYLEPKPPRGERIAVIGAGPAGLTYAALVAEGNKVTVFEKGALHGGAFRYAGRAPLFQEVEASETSLSRYVNGLYRACLLNGVVFYLGTDVRRERKALEPFDRVVIASGAYYRFGLGWIVRAILRRGVARRRGFSWLFSSPRFRDWFYYTARRETGSRIRRLVRDKQIVMVIGDAARPGKSKEAVASAFDAALLDGAP